MTPARHYAPGALLALSLLTLAGCFGGNTFNCQADDTRCEPGERCIFDRCAVRDTACAGTGFRFARSAGAQANLCVDMLPDGGLACSAAGDPCDDGDACTLDDTCAQDLTCKGTKKDCGGSSCNDGVQSDPVCEKGECVQKMTPCSPYPCSGVACATTCQSFSDCAPGYYCASQKCLSCGDFTSNASYQPQFTLPAAIPGTVNSPQTVEDAPFLSSDGKTLYFASNRAGGSGGLDLYTATRTIGDFKTPFGNVQNMGTPVNSPRDDSSPFTLDGNQLLFDRDVAMMPDRDLWQSTRMNNLFGTPAMVPGGVTGKLLNQVGAVDAHPVLTDNALRLFFESDRLGPGMGRMFGDKQAAVFFATRTNPNAGFGAANQLTGLDSTVSWASPSVTRNGRALFMVNVGTPTRTQVGIVHLDVDGNVTGTTAVVRAIDPMSGEVRSMDLGAGARVAISADSCTLLMSSTKEDGRGELLWSYRSSAAFCNQSACGPSDSCCAVGCTGLYDDDCPLPRTFLVAEFYSTMDDNHDYRLAGEAPLAGYTATGKNFRVFVDPPAGAKPLYRLSTTTCDGKRYTYVGTESTRTGYTQERLLGYIIDSGAGGTARVYRAKKESVGTACDSFITFDLTACKLVEPNYLCEPSLGFGVRP